MLSEIASASALESHIPGGSPGKSVPSSANVLLSGEVVEGDSTSPVVFDCTLVLTDLGSSDGSEWS